METQHYDLLCLSHLRWNFVFQRPQHLMTRCGRERRVFFVEEPLFEASDNELRVENVAEQVTVLTPLLSGERREHVAELQQDLLQQYFSSEELHRFVAWYYTPLALDWMDTRGVAATVYDCMDELTLFKGAPSSLKEKEAELFSQADLVFTGGVSLYRHKRSFHPNVYAFPSAVEFSHFAKAREMQADPDDQRNIPHPRLGFFGVIDERMDIELLDQLSQLRPDYQIVLIGPVVKIDPETLPRRSNIHYLGQKQYSQLPLYLSGWDVGIMPFARNDSTRFISPTKTPEYLAAGRPVVSTSITDVVSPYGERNLVRIADSPAEFAHACEKALREDSAHRHARVAEFLSGISWDTTWRSMSELIDSVIEVKTMSRRQERVAE